MTNRKYIETPFHDVSRGELTVRHAALRDDEENQPLDAERDRYDLELRQSRDLVEESQSRYARLYNDAPVAFVTLDNSGLIVEANATAVALFGRPLDELVNRPFAAAALGKSYDALTAHLRECLASQKLTIREVEWTSPAGAPGTLQLSTRVQLNAMGSVTGYLMTVIDTTAINLVKAEAIELEKQQAARWATDEANRLRTEFLAQVSHEIRTSIHSVLGWTQVMTTHRGDHALVEHAVSVVERDARVVARIVDDILDISHVVAGDLHMDLAEMDLAEVVRAAVEAIRPIAGAKPVDLIESVAIEGRLRGDAVRLRQVVDNLLSNALKFTQAGSRINVTLVRVGSVVRLMVSDGGCGIDPRDLPHVFEGFRQVEGATDRGYKGLGLGLAITKYVVEAHGGKIFAESEGLGWGTMMTVDLPAPCSDEPVGVRAPSMAPPAKTLAGVKVLFVDDDTSSSDLAEIVLGDYGARVASASSVDEAMRLLQELRYDVVITDLGMPGRDGFDLLRAVRRLPDPVGSVPVIAMTAFGRAEGIEQSRAAGFDRFLGKPTDSEDLVFAICDVLDRDAKAPSSE